MRIERFLPRALSSGAFRFALVLAAVFALGSALLLWAMERQVSRYAAEATNTMLRSEATALADEYRGEGLAGLVDAIRYRGNAPDSPYHYVLAQAGHRLAGDLPLGSATLGWQTRREAEPGDRHAKMHHFGIGLPDGLTLVVASDTFDIEKMRDRLEHFTIAAGIAITLFAMLGGILAGQMFLARLERINRAVANIIAGSSGQRLPRIGVGPEFDHLTQNLNLMIERQAAAAEGLKQVSAAVAHELRTPMARLKQRLEAIRDADEQEGGGQEAGEARAISIDDAIGQIDAILVTFQSLLRIGMLEGGAGRQRFAEVDLTELIERVYQAYQPVAEDAGHILIHEAGATARVAVRGDGELLAQLLVNLVENALSHTPEGTRIWLHLARAGHKAIVTVRDDGPGVATEEYDKLFTKFYRASGHGKTGHGHAGGAEGGGAGLGLALVAAIAELHEAEYRIVPEETGFCLEVAFETC